MLILMNGFLSLKRSLGETIINLCKTMLLSLELRVMKRIQDSQGMMMSRKMQQSHRYTHKMLKELAVLLSGLKLLREIHLGNLWVQPVWLNELVNKVVGNLSYWRLRIILFKLLERNKKGYHKRYWNFNKVYFSCRDMGRKTTKLHLMYLSIIYTINMIIAKHLAYKGMILLLLKFKLKMIGSRWGTSLRYW